MKYFRSILVFTILASLMLTSCNKTNKTPVKGVESSVNETGDIQSVKITANNCNVTMGCDPNSTVIQSCNKNTQLNVLNEVNKDWLAVKLDNNKIGFVPQKQCTPVLPNNAVNNTNQAPKTPVPTPNKTNPIINNNMGNNNLIKMPPVNNNNISTPNNNTPNNNTTNNTTTNNNTETDDKKNTTTNQSITNEEQQLIDLINQSRQQNGLKALIPDNQLSEVARIKSKDMVDNNYFSHNSPTYGDPFKMLKDFGFQYLRAAENIAGNSSVEKAHEALMNSPGHRKNILTPEFTHVGVGIQKGSQYGYMFTELFITK